MNRGYFLNLLKLLIILTLFSIKDAYAYDNNYGPSPLGGWNSVQRHDIKHAETIAKIDAHFAAEAQRKAARVALTQSTKPLSLEIEGQRYEIQRLLPSQDITKPNKGVFRKIGGFFSGIWSGKDKTPSGVGLIYADPTNKALSDYSAIRINDSVYELQKLSTGQAVYKQRDYQDLIKKHQSQLIEVRPKFLTNSQITQMQTNLNQQINKPFSFSDRMPKNYSPNLGSVGIGTQYPTVKASVLQNEFNRAGVQGIQHLKSVVDISRDIIRPNFKDPTSIGAQFWTEVYKNPPVAGASLTTGHVTWNASTAGKGIGLSSTPFGASIDFQSRRVEGKHMELGTIARHTGAGVIVNKALEPQAMTIHLGLSFPDIKTPVYVSMPIYKQSWQNNIPKMQINQPTKIPRMQHNYTPSLIDMHRRYSMPAYKMPTMPKIEPIRMPQMPMHITTPKPYNPPSYNFNR